MALRIAHVPLVPYEFRSRAWVFGAGEDACISSIQFLPLPIATILYTARFVATICACCPTSFAAKDLVRPSADEWLLALRTGALCLWVARQVCQPHLLGIRVSLALVAAEYRSVAPLVFGAAPWAEAHKLPPFGCPCRTTAAGPAYGWGVCAAGHPKPRRRDLPSRQPRQPRRFVKGPAGFVVPRCGGVSAGFSGRRGRVKLVPTGRLLPCRSCVNAEPFSRVRGRAGRHR